MTYKLSLLTICLLAFALRLHLLEDIFWHDDEVKSQRLYVEQSPAQILTHYTVNNHWLSSGLGHLMRYLGPQRFLLRWPSVFWGTLAVPLLAVAGHRLFRRPQEGLLAALLLAFSAFHIQWSQQFRGYTALLFFSLLAFLLLLQALQKGSKRLWLFFVVTVLLTITSHLFGVLMGLTLLVILAGWTVYNLASRKREAIQIKLRLVVFLTLLIILVYFTWFAKVHVLDYYHTLPDISLSQFVYYQFMALVPTLEVVYGFWREIVIAFTAYREPGIATLLFLGPVSLGLHLSLARFPRSTLLLLVWLAFPLFLVILAEFMVPGFFVSDRYLIFILPAWLLWVSRSLLAALDWLTPCLVPAKQYQQPFSAALLILITAYLGWLNLQIIQHYIADRAGHDWRTIAAYLAERLKPGDLIICKQLPHTWPPPRLEVEERCAKEMEYRLQARSKKLDLPSTSLEKVMALDTWFRFKEKSQASGGIWLVVWGEMGTELPSASILALAPLDWQPEAAAIPRLHFNRLGQTSLLEVRRHPYLTGNLSEAIGHLAELDSASLDRFDYYLGQAQTLAYQGRIAEAQTALKIAQALVPERREAQAYLTQNSRMIAFNFLQPHQPPVQPLQIDFGQPPLLRLTGYSLPQPLSAGKVGLMTIAWQALQPVNTDYTIFLHLRDRNGQIAAQLDFRPFEGAYPTSQWQPGLNITESRPWQLPAQLRPGSYTLHLGLYHLESLAPLVPTQAESDAGALLGEIKIE